MRSQFLALLRNEISKAVRRKLPYFGIGALALLSVVVFFVAGRLSTAASSNAWGYVAFSMQLLFTDLGPIFIIVFSAMALSEETGSGTIRALLAAPVHRWELYLAKAAVGLLYMLVLSIAGLVFSIVFAKIHYQFGAVADVFGTVYTREKALREFSLALLLSWIPLGALSMCALFASTIIRTPGAAVAIGISGLFLVDFTKHLVGLDPYIFTKYLSSSWSNVQMLAQGMDYQWFPELWKMLLLCCAYALLSFCAGLFVFVKEDLNH